MSDGRIRHLGFVTPPGVDVFESNDQTFAIEHRRPTRRSDDGPTRLIWRVPPRARLDQVLRNDHPLRSFTPDAHGRPTDEEVLERLLGFEPPSVREVYSFLCGLGANTGGMGDRDVYGLALNRCLIDLPTYDRGLEALRAHGPSAAMGVPIERLPDNDGRRVYLVGDDRFTVEGDGGRRLIWGPPAWLVPIRDEQVLSATDAEALLRLAGALPPSRAQLRRWLSGPRLPAVDDWDRDPWDIYALGLRMGVVDLPTYRFWLRANPPA